MFFRNKTRTLILLRHFSQCNFKIFRRRPTLVAFLLSPPLHHKKVSYGPGVNLRYEKQLFTSGIVRVNIFICEENIIDSIEDIIAFWKIFSNHWGGIRNKTIPDNDYEERSGPPKRPSRSEIFEALELLQNCSLFEEEQATFYLGSHLEKFSVLYEKTL